MTDRALRAGEAFPPHVMPLSRHQVDRDYLARGRPELFSELGADPATRVLPIWQGKTLMSSDVPERLLLLSPADAPEARAQLYLGRSTSVASREPAGTPLIGAILDDDAAASLAEPEQWVGLRDVGALLDARDAGLLTEAVALANWHSSHRFSPRSGQPLIPEQGGWVLRASDDSLEVFPRTDPAIIVAVLDGQDRLLLGSNAMWQVDRFSLLAGFVEPGESLEAAVEREIFEESGVRVSDPRYLGSQPWPFPSSLMLGFSAMADEDQDWALTPDGTEILDLRWFTREELQDKSDLILPGPTSIARAIIDNWIAGKIGPPR
ncbi:MAG: NAD(+) diphosphatase [Terrimesophilobacter sp.]